MILKINCIAPFLDVKNNCWYYIKKSKSTQDYLLKKGFLVFKDAFQRLFRLSVEEKM